MSKERNRGHSAVVLHLCKNHHNTGAGGWVYESFAKWLGVMNYTQSGGGRVDDKWGPRLRKEVLRRPGNCARW